jgi:hypothetical protein
MNGAAALSRVTTTLVTGASARPREQLIAAQLSLHPPRVQDRVGTPGTPDTPGAPAPIAVLLEGLPDGTVTISPSPSVLIERIAPGCLCCTGNLVLRVTLNRLLRRRPERLYIGLAATAHLDQLRSWLQQPPYDQLLELTPDLST